MSSERDPLLSPQSVDIGNVDHTIESYTSGESSAHGSATKRKLGLTSAIFLIFNRMIGTGIFATPGVILRSVGSVGLALCLWLLGAAVAATGTAVYIEFGTGLPRSGGEKNYLEFLYKYPRFLSICIYAVYAVFNGWTTANAVVFDTIHALGLMPTLYNVRFAGIGCLTFCFLIHSVFMTWGLRLQNLLGFAKLFILLAIILIGTFHLTGVPGFELREGVEVPHNLEWSTLFKGSNSGITAFITGLYTVIWSFFGYSNANYALSEIRNPIWTIKRAAPLALLLVATFYMLINVAYFGVVSRTDILSSGQIIAALFFGNLFGSGTERLLSFIIALSTLGNSLAVAFTHGRVVQELGREDLLPYSGFFASNRPFDSPMAGLFIQWLVSSMYILAPPPGDAYLFMVNVSSYPVSLINAFLSGGLLFLYLKKEELAQWNPPFRAYKAAVVFYFLSNVLLVTAPLVPPAKGFAVYEHLPYFLHVLVAWIIGLFGVVYWYIWTVWIPKREGYRLEREEVVLADGTSRSVLRNVPR